MNLIGSWVSLKSHNYIDGAQIAEQFGAEIKEQFGSIRETRSLRIAICHSKEQDLRLN